MLRIGIDIDDTICSTNELIIIEADKYDKEELKGTGIKNPLAYEFTEMMGWDNDGKGRFFSDRLESIFNNTMVKPFAKDVINKLYYEGNEIYFISFRKDKYIANPYGLTARWLLKNNIKYTKLIVNSGEKGDDCKNEKIDLFIDDSESHCKDVSDEGIDVLLFTNAYNHLCNDFRRVDDWNQIYKIIKEEYNG